MDRDTVLTSRSSLCVIEFNHRRRTLFPLLREWSGNISRSAFAPRLDEPTYLTESHEKGNLDLLGCGVDRHFGDLTAASTTVVACSAGGLVMILLANSSATSGTLAACHRLRFRRPLR